MKILIDAEEFLIQNAIDQLALEMMIEYNKNEIFIYNTVQMYRKDRLTYLKKITTENPGILFGFKLVRGAYMEKEIFQNMIIHLQFARINYLQTKILIQPLNMFSKLETD